AAHMVPVSETVDDFVAVAERFTGTPYLWGGRTSFGLDCSALVQVSLQAAGAAPPRDSDMQEAVLGEALDVATDLSALRRGDLVFWKGHMGVMRDPVNLLHADAHHMAVASEPLQDAVARIAEAKGPVTSIRRLARGGRA
ncbi:MAG: NlpC/P60 family protein, partial [Hyphomicrobiales bacterium]|nr:NlpC/P60 family protein [Hyphomicrobiales bacterium]